LGYDANGNPTAVDGVEQYRYDAFNRMDAATSTINIARVLQNLKENEGNSCKGSK